MPVSDIKCSFGTNVSQRGAARIRYFKPLIKKNTVSHLPCVIYVALREIVVRMLITGFRVAHSIGICDLEVGAIEEEEGRKCHQVMAIQ